VRFPALHSLSPAEISRLFLGRAEGLYRYLEERIPPRFAAVITPDDVLQDVWISAFRGFSSFEAADDEALDHWLRTIASRKLLDLLKAARRAKRGGSGQGSSRASEKGTRSYVDLVARVASTHRTPSRETSAKEAAFAVQIALSDLGPEQRTALRLRYVEGRSLDEIASAMNKSAVAVNGLLFRGLRQLRRRLGRAGRYFSDSASCDAVPVAPMV
jgi:RNA polymerase sigma factor (sigma-70 family)